MDDFQEFLPWASRRMEQSGSEKEINGWVAGGWGTKNQEFDVCMGCSSRDAELGHWMNRSRVQRKTQDQTKGLD